MNLLYMYQCSRYIHGDIGDRCPAKPVSELILMKATCEMLNELVIKNNGVFKKILNHINEILGSRNLTDDINKKLVERDDIEKRLNFYLEQKMKSRDENERYYLEGKYTIDLRKLNELDNELKELEAKQMESENLCERIEIINKLLDVEEITPEMLTIDIVDAVIYKIIVIDKRNIIFCIDVNHELNYQEFVDKRKELTYNKPILEGITHHQGTQRLDFVNYKVITF